MPKDYGPSCRLCRREGTKLFLKGTKCSTEKCPFNKRDYSPGQHGQKRVKLSDYGRQLREKQKVKRIYGVLERQFRFYFRKAERSREVTGEKLLELLERRLDNVIYRLGLATSRAQARQMVRHNFIYVNQKRVNLPNFMVKKGDVLEIKSKKEKALNYLKQNLEKVKERGIPPWLNFDLNLLRATVADLPKREDVGFPIEEQLIVELYSK